MDFPSTSFIPYSRRKATHERADTAYFGFLVGDRIKKRVDSRDLRNIHGRSYCNHQFHTTSSVSTDSHFTVILTSYILLTQKKEKGEETPGSIDEKDIYKAQWIAATVQIGSKKGERVSI